MKKNLFLLFVISVVFIVTGCLNVNDDSGYSGRIEAAETDICSEVSGIIKKINVSEGDAVKENQILLEIDDEIYRLKLKQIEASLEASQAKLNEALSGTRNQKIKASESAVEAVQAGLKQAEEDLLFYEKKEKRYKELMEEGAVDRETYEGIELSLQKAKSQVSSLKHQLEKAQSELDLLIAGNTSNYIKILRADLKKVEMVKEEAELNLGKCSIHAFQEGIVTSKNYEVGEFIGIGSKLLSLIDFNDMWLYFYIPQSELGNWELGDRVNLNADAFPEISFSGEVIYISPEAEFTPKNVQTKEARMDTVFKIKVKVTDGVNKLRPGMWVDVVKGEAK
jgi:HlyD family secretion protein